MNKFSTEVPYNLPILIVCHLIFISTLLVWISPLVPLPDTGSVEGTYIQTTRPHPSSGMCGTSRLWFLYRYVTSRTAAGLSYLQ